MNTTSLLHGLECIQCIQHFTVLQGRDFTFHSKMIVVMQHMMLLKYPLIHEHMHGCHICV